MKNSKKLLCFVLSAMMLLSSFVVFAADDDASADVTVNLNGETMTFDVDPIIENGRTLVPLRAISESLDCTVDWYGDIRTAAIHKKYGQYEIGSGHLEKTLSLENGVDLAYISCSYPIIKSDNELNKTFVEDINAQYKAKAENYIADVEKQHYEDAKLMCEEMGMESYTPMSFDLSYTVNTNRKNILSITTYENDNANGVHPSQTLESRSFQMILCKELSIADVFDCEENDAEQTIYDSFISKLESLNIEVDEETANRIAETKASFYLTDNSMVAYYNQGDVASYAVGRIDVEFPYSETDSLVKLDLSEANLDNFEFELDGNPTTGYSWQVVFADADKVKVDSEYVQDEAEEGMVGVGGKYKFNVSGISEGNAVVELYYMRANESYENAEKMVSYSIYVSKDNKITVLDKEEK